VQRSIGRGPGGNVPCVNLNDDRVFYLSRNDDNDWDNEGFGVVDVVKI
jgi:hypothetical protein